MHVVRAAAFVAATAGLAGVSAAQVGLTADQVLVVFDGRSAEGAALAAAYVQARPGAVALDLAAGSPPPFSVGAATITQNEFRGNVAGPVRTFLTEQGLERKIRAAVLCRPIPHRIADTDSPTIGDSPVGQSQEVSARDATAASVDSELAALWFELNPESEAGGPGDSFLDGRLLNPYYGKTLPINAFRNDANAIPGALALEFPGGESGRRSRLLPALAADGTGPGSVLLVTRLDGPTAADAEALIGRAAGVVWDVEEAAFVFDESNSNGVADPFPNGELDNFPPASAFRDDYELARDELLADGRFEPALVVYDGASGGQNFVHGPLLDFSDGIETGVTPILLASYGSNHAGLPSGPEGLAAGIALPLSFVLPGGSVFNTLESYAGRAFNGLGGFQGQGRLGDFIGAGGAFGLGSVWEPLADSVPDNEWLVRNFFLGGLTWAEAAYSASPFLSWQWLAIGDPLARPVRSAEDTDGDGDLDVDDLYGWYERGTPDIDGDGVGDAADASLLVGSVRALRPLLSSTARDD